MLIVYIRNQKLLSHGFNDLPNVIGSRTIVGQMAIFWKMVLNWVAMSLGEPYCIYLLSSPAIAFKSVTREAEGEIPAIQFNDPFVSCHREMYSIYHWIGMMLSRMFSLYTCIIVSFMYMKLPIVKSWFLRLSLIWSSTTAPVWEE